MINDDELKKIIKVPDPQELNKLEVIQRYIYDIKGKDVGQIKPIKNPIQHWMMQSGYEAALNYYQSTLKDEEV